MPYIFLKFPNKMPYIFPQVISKGSGSPKKLTIYAISVKPPDTGHRHLAWQLIRPDSILITLLAYIFVLKPLKLIIV
jgi:hypothetical protein